MATIKNCKYAFSSFEEEKEWQNLISMLNLSELFPIERLIESTENVERLRRHGYVVSLSYAPNMYKITKLDN